MFTRTFEWILINAEWLLPSGAVTGVVMVLLSAKLNKDRPYTSLWRFLGGMLFLMVTWIVLLGLVVALTVRATPWDQTWVPPPPKGTWQRQMNDFLNTRQYLPAVVIMGISVGIFLTGMLRTANGAAWSWIPFGLAVTHLLFFLLAGLSTWLADYFTTLWLPPPHTDADIVGYHRVGLSLVVNCVLLGLLFWSQIKLISLSFWKRHWWQIVQSNPNTTI